MLMSVNIHQAKTQLSQLIERVERGEEIIIARAGRPVAKLVRFEPETNPRQPGLLRGQIHLAEDFDAPLPPEVLAGFVDGP
jgi:prevent-host-death family protein